MSKHNTIFDNGEKKEKLQVGPTREIPGPTLLIAVNTEVNDVAKS